MFPNTNPYLTLTYDSETLYDGVGAQLERIWNIYWCTKKFKVNYLHSPITNIVHHPCDLWKGAREKEDFIRQVNHKFNLSSNSREGYEKVKTYKVLKRPQFFVNYIQSVIQKKSTLLRVCNMFDVPPKDLPYPPCIKNQIEQEKQKLIVAHIRNALPLLGVSQRRNLDITYYQELIKHFTDKLIAADTSYQVIILTDYPKFDTKLRISSIDKDEVWMWFFTSDQIKQDIFEITGVDLKSMYFLSDSNVKVIHGGDVMESLRIMAVADFLILSRSSLSSVGGKLNLNGTVIIPPEFFHKAFKKWIPASSFINIRKEWRETRYPRTTSLLPPSFLRQGRFFLRIARKTLNPSG